LLVLVGCARSERAWQEDLRAADPFVRALGAFGLAADAPGRADAAVPVLLETVDRVELGLAPEARRVLVGLAPVVHEALLDELFADEFMTSDRRQAVVSALGAAGAAAVDPVLAALRGRGRSGAGDLGDVLATGGPDPALRAFALFLVGELGARAQFAGAHDVLSAALDADDARVRQMAATALARLEAARAEGADTSGSPASQARPGTPSEGAR
jgi:hypothetical protein